MVILKKGLVIDMYDIRLVTLMKLVNIKNYTKTAKELNFTQPTVTQHVKSLEKEYNIKIFTKELNLTNAGKMLYEYAKQVNYNHNLFLTNINNLIQFEEKINLGMIDSIYYNLSKTAFFSDLIKYSKNQIAVIVMSNDELNKALLSAKIDFGFTNIKSDNPNIVIDEIMQDEIIIAVRREHNILKKETSYKKYYLTTLDNNDPYHQSLEKYLSDNNLDKNNFKNAIETNNLDLSLKLVLKNNAIGTFYKSNVIKELKSHELVIYKETNIDTPIYLIKNNINYDNNKLQLLNLILEKIKE